MAKRIETLKEREKKFEYKDWLKYIKKVDEAVTLPLKPKPLKPLPLEPQLYAFPTEVLCPPGQDWEPEGYIPGKCVSE